MQFNLVGVASRKRIVLEIYAKPALLHKQIENAGYEILIVLIKTNLTAIEQQHEK